jgi:hypothetical protein
MIPDIYAFNNIPSVSLTASSPPLYTELTVMDKYATPSYMSLKDTNDTIVVSDVSSITDEDSLYYNDTSRLCSDTK